jgi:hypothetical protein
VWEYIRALWESQATFDKPEKVQCDRMKKFVNFLGEGVPAPFLHQIRRADTADTFHRICAEFPRPRRADDARAVGARRACHRVPALHRRLASGAACRRGRPSAAEGVRRLIVPAAAS